MNRICVSTASLRYNLQVNQPREPVFIVVAEDGTERRAWSVSIAGPSRLVFSLDMSDRLPNGAVAWVETDAEVTSDFAID